MSTFIKYDQRLSQERPRHLLIRLNLHLLRLKLHHRRLAHLVATLKGRPYFHINHVWIFLAETLLGAEMRFQVVQVELLGHYLLLLVVDVVTVLLLGFGLLKVGFLVFILTQADANINRLGAYRV